MANNAFCGQVAIVSLVITLSLTVSFFDQEVVMPSTKVADDLIENWEDFPLPGKTELISIFLNECGEGATWEEWCAFLHKYQAKGFEWIDEVN